MKIRELENYLSQCESFTNPKVEFEQYNTSAHIAARMLFAAQEQIQDSLVCDLGSGCGILSVGAVMCGAKFVIGLEIDEEAIETAIENRDEILDKPDSSKLEFIQSDTKSFRNEPRFQALFDVIVMNPPFGTKTVGADSEFLTTASKLVKRGGHIYSLHKTSTRPFFLKKGNDLGLEGSVLAQVHFDIPKSYKFHKSKSKDVEVDFWDFKKYI